MANNLLIITQQVDQEKDLLGFFVGWINEFAKRFDQVFVITLYEGVHRLAPNVTIYSLGKEHESNKIIRALRFYWLLFKLVPRSKGIFAHMSPIFVIASWPITVLFRKRIIFWYLHRSVTLKLKITEVMCYKIVTAVRESLMFSSKKIVEVGHGLEVDSFKTDRNWAQHSTQWRILSIGRFSRIKNYETLIRATRILRDHNIDFKLIIIARPVMKTDEAYEEEIKKMVMEYGLSKIVKFIDTVPYSLLPNYFKQSDVFVNLTPTGGLDKVVIEAMASGLITLVSNTAFERYFDEYSTALVFKLNNPIDLAKKIEAVIELPPESLGRLSQFLTMSANKHFRTANLISKISKLYIN